MLAPQPLSTNSEVKIHRNSKMRIGKFLLLATVAAGLAHAKTDLVFFGSTGKAPPGMFPFFTIPAPTDGIYAGKFDENTGQLTDIHQVTQVLRPSMVIINPDRPILYAVNELGGKGPEHAQIISYKYDPGTGALTKLGTADTGGRGTNFASIDMGTHTLFAASYASGQVSVMPLNPDGTVGKVTSIDTHTGHGPTPRQQAPHVHAAVLDPSGKYVLVTDLGNDRLYVYKFDAATHTITAAATPYITLPPGSGPRHLLFVPGTNYVILNSEMSAQVFVLKWDSNNGTLSLGQTVDLEPADFKGMKSAAEILLSQDGKTLYVCNRSDSSIDSFHFDNSTGQLTPFQRISAGGKLPWSLTIDPSGHWLLVALNGSNKVDVFKLGRDGAITATGNGADVLAPSSIAFVGS